MPTFTIPEPAEFDGEWWLPDGRSDVRHVAGRLSWSKSKGRLELHDAFTSVTQSASFGDGHRYPAVHGTSTKSLLISVLDALSLGGGLSFGAAGLREAENLVSSWVIVGAHVSKETKFNELSLRIPGLQVWLGGRGAQQTFVHKTSDQPSRMLYSFEGVDEERISVPTAGLTLGFSIARNFSGSVDSEVVVSTSVYLRLISAEPQTLTWLLEQFGKVSTLLAFISGSPMGADHVTAKLSDGHSVEVLVAMREAKCCEYKTAADFFMRRNQMQCELAAVVVRWFELYDSVAMPSQLALSVLYSKDLWLHVEFLSMTQALEGFHRATMDGVYVTTEQYAEVEEKVVQAIPSSVPPDLRSSLKARLKYGNEVSLRKRLDALASRLGPDIRTVLLALNGRVPSAWVDTRNYYTHWDQTTRQNVLDGGDMHRASFRMRTFLRVLYLNLVGVPTAAIAQALAGSSNESQYLSQLNAGERLKAQQAAAAKVDGCC